MDSQSGGMSTSSQEPSFLSCLAREPMRGTWQTDVLRRRCVLFLPFLVAGLGLCLTGIATRHAQRHKFEFLLGLLYERAPDRGELESLTKDLPSLIRERLDTYRSSCGKGPDSLSVCPSRRSLRTIVSVSGCQQRVSKRQQD